MESYQVGSNIDSWCTKCKLVLAHTIEAVSAGVIKRVQCNTCRGKHQYKSEEPGTKTAKSAAKKTKSSATSKGKAKVGDLTRLMRGRRPEQAVPYNSKTQFAKGDLLEHVVFGLGVVVERRDSQKIEVLFPSGSKILVHARG